MADGYFRTEIRIAGFGGQGIVTLSRMITFAAYNAGHYATDMVSYGSESRGGAAWAEVIVSTEMVDYPKAVLPDFVILFAQEAANTFGRSVREGGTVLYDPLAIGQLATKEGVRVISVPASEMARTELEAVIAANTVMFGAFVGLTGLFPRRAAEDAVRAAIGGKAEELNLNAFARGLALTADTSPERPPAPPAAGKARRTKE